MIKPHLEKNPKFIEKFLDAIKKTPIFVSLTKTQRQMKHLYYNTPKVDLMSLNLRALNLKSGEFQSTINVPDGMYLKITLADKFDTEVGSLDEVSAETSVYAARHGKHRSILLVHGGRVVGWAEFHRASREFTVDVTVKVEGEVTVPITVTAKTLDEATRKAEPLARGYVDALLDNLDADGTLEDFDISTYIE
jgi:hypothetical protein